MGSGLLAAVGQRAKEKQHSGAAAVDRKHMRAYLDYNATAPLRAEARAAMQAALELAGNPSSIHAEGRAARALVEDARRDVAALAGANAREVTFTAGGTEAVNLALAPASRPRASRPCGG